MKVHMQLMQIEMDVYMQKSGREQRERVVTGITRLKKYSTALYTTMNQWNIW